MRKAYFKAVPLLALALLINAVTAFVDAFTVIKASALLDICLYGNAIQLRSELPLLILFLTVTLPLHLLEGYISIRYTKKANVELRNGYTERLLRLDFAKLHGKNTDKLLSSMTDSMATLESDYVIAIYRIGTALFSLGAAIWMLASASPTMLLVAVIIVALNVVISYLTSLPSGKAYAKRKQILASYTAYIKEFLASFFTFYVNNLQEKVAADFEKQQSFLEKSMYELKRLFTRIGATETFWVTLTTYASVCTVGLLSATGLITLGGFMVSLQGLLDLPTPLMGIVEQFPLLIGGRAVLKDIESETSPTTKRSSGRKSCGFHNNIVFQNVDFSYAESERSILSADGIEIKRGDKYLICGQSGGGKSTLLKLIQRVHEPTSGTIYLDGEDIQCYEDESYRSLFAYVEQHVFLMEDSLLNNITMYRDVSNARLKTIIRQSGLETFVAGLPDELDTVIYDNGKNISGGQRSRIAIARSLAADAPVLILDEAFAALDVETAAEIERAILSLEGLTVLNVSHVFFRENLELYDCVYKVERKVSPLPLCSLYDKAQ